MTLYPTILHTWNQNLMYHSHIHCIVPLGGLSNLGNKWNNSNEKFFIPVKVLLRKFIRNYIILKHKALY